MSPASLAESAEAPAHQTGPIVFFDGVCGLCNRSVDFLIRHDPNHRYRYAPLQGETARERLHLPEGVPLKSIVLCDGTGTYRRSAAVSRVLRGLGGIWAVLGWSLWLVPWPLRDLGYEIIARNRYRWFGEKQSCRLPSPAERALFLP